MGGRGVPDEDERLQRSSRDAGRMQAVLTEWIDQQHPGADAVVELLGDVAANGMSSETLLADVTWTEDGERRKEAFVVRMAPDPNDFPIFPTYQLDHQFELLRLVGELTDVPVPTPSWLGIAGGGLDAPFFFMSREAGRVPPDVLPYPFGDNWLFDATPEEQQRLQRSTIEVIAKLHAIPNPTETFEFLPGDGTLAAHLAKTKAWYEWAVEDSGRSKMIDRAMSWLETNLPEETEPVLCWGDSRIGNVLYRDFVPEAILDWEMATLGPREMDLA